MTSPYRLARNFLIVAAITLATALLCQPARADNAQPSVFASVNATWLHGPGASFPVDLEAGGNAKASLSPHISAVGGLFFGVTHSYLRYQGGLRYTTTDVLDHNFNTFLGLLYRGGSIATLQPSELAPDAGFGWRPWPERLPNLIVGGEASVGHVTSLVEATLGVRYQFSLK